MARCGPENFREPAGIAVDVALSQSIDRKRIY